MVLKGKNIDGDLLGKSVTVASVNQPVPESMIHQRHIKLKIALISIALLIGQFAALIHSVDHPFHEFEQSCQVFVHLEESGHGLIADILSTSDWGAHVFVTGGFPALSSFDLQTAYLIRAPPARS